MSGRTKLESAIKKTLATKEDMVNYIPGELGRYIDGVTVVEVPDRVSYVYVRLWSNPADWIEAYNDTVNTIYGLPVMVARDKITPDRYRVIGKDIKRYSEWNAPAGSQIARHAPQHSFGSGELAGNDIVWVFKRQFMPLLVRPSSGYQVYCESEWYQWDSDPIHFRGETVDLEYIVPSSTGSAVFVTLAIDGTTNAIFGTTGTVFTSYVDIEEKIPLIDLNDGVLLASVLLYGGQTAITWDDIYDLRLPFGKGGGGSALTDIILYSGGVSNAYDPNDAGLTSALSAAIAGDSIQLPPETTFSSIHTLPASVHMFGLDRKSCVFSNTLYVNPGSDIESFSIHLTGATGSSLYGFYADFSGSFGINNCDIEVINSATGSSYVGYVDLQATLTVENSHTYASTYPTTPLYLIE